MDYLFNFEARIQVTLADDTLDKRTVFGKIEETLDNAELALEGVDGVVTEMAFDRGSETFDAPPAEVEVLSKRIITDAEYYAAPRHQVWG